MSEAPLLVVGDSLLDRDVEGEVQRLCPDAPAPVLDERFASSRPGGAALAATLAARGERPVTLLTALARDAAGEELAALLDGLGVEVIDVGLHGPTPEKVRLRCGGRTLLRLDRGGQPPAAVGERRSAAARAAIGWAAGILVADYGRGVAAQRAIRRALTDRAAEGAPITWDPHPRGPRPVLGTFLATPNIAEAAALAPAIGGDPEAARSAIAQRLRERWHVKHLCITCGQDGAVLDSGSGGSQAFPARAVEAGDPCGAGDRFAASAAGMLADGASPVEAVAAAVADASSFVAAGGASQVRCAPTLSWADWSTSDARHVVEATRRAGGAVVATGGCFDLLHAGHIHTLREARRLGDCLIVCLNGDASVRRLKGPGRPVVCAADRAALLNALACVDAVAVFEDDTPVQLLEQLRPDVWAKGGDYAGAMLPESEALASWGGRTVLLSHIPGHSTSRLIEEAGNRVAI